MVAIRDRDRHRLRPTCVVRDEFLQGDIPLGGDRRKAPRQRLVADDQILNGRRLDIGGFNLSARDAAFAAMQEAGELPKARARYPLSLLVTRAPPVAVHHSDHGS